MFDIFQEHDKIKTQRSLHRMFILFTRLVLFLFPPPTPHSYFKTVQTGNTLLKKSPLCTKDSIPLPLPGWRVTGSPPAAPVLSL